MTSLGRRRGCPPVSFPRLWLCLLTLFALLPFSAAQQDPPDCQAATNRCFNAHGCKQVFFNFQKLCNSLLTGEAAVCSQECAEAVLALSLAQYGRDFLECDCRDQAGCVSGRARLLSCSSLTRAVIKRSNVDRSPTCHFAQFYCAGDTGCATALEEFLHRCSYLWSPKKQFVPKCKKRCRMSYQTLYEHPRSCLLKVCRCGGPSDHNVIEPQACMIMKESSEKYCSKSMTHRSLKLRVSSFGFTEGPLLSSAGDRPTNGHTAACRSLPLPSFFQLGSPPPGMKSQQSSDMALAFEPLRNVTEARPPLVTTGGNSDSEGTAVLVHLPNSSGLLPSDLLISSFPNSSVSLSSHVPISSHGGCGCMQKSLIGYYIFCLLMSYMLRVL